MVLPKDCIAEALSNAAQNKSVALPVSSQSQIQLAKNRLSVDTKSDGVCEFTW